MAIAPTPTAPLQGTVLLKLSGTILPGGAAPDFGQRVAFAKQVVQQIVALASNMHLGIVIGGGNLFRGSQHGKALGVRRSTGDNVGMLATVQNALVLSDLLEQQGVSCAVLSALSVPTVAHPPSDRYIKRLVDEGKLIVFAGGIGTPYFSTDTSAVVRALQMGASQIWKMTDVDGVYSADPANNSGATLLPHVTYQEAISKQLGIMDMTALVLAAQHKLKIRVGNIQMPHILQQMLQDASVGSIID